MGIVAASRRGWYQRSPMADKPKNRKSCEPACRVGWLIAARRGRGGLRDGRRSAKSAERYGFEPVETPAMEFTDALGKFLPDQDRPNEGIVLVPDDDEQWISLPL